MEAANAIATWRRNPDIVAGVSLGNEIVLGKRGDWALLHKFIVDFRQQAPGLPLTVSEPFAQFLDEGAKSLFPVVDFMLVNVHPVFQPRFNVAPPFNWAQFVVRVVDRIAAEIYCGPVIVKETAVPTGSESLGYDEAKQQAFYRELHQQFPPTHTRSFAYAAFDTPWLVDAPNPIPWPHPEEAFWGLFTDTRTPKAVAGDLKPLPDNAK